MEFKNNIVSVNDEKIIMKTKKSDLVIPLSKVDSIQIYIKQSKITAIVSLLILAISLALIFSKTELNFIWFVITSIFSILMTLIAISNWIGEYVVEYVISGKKRKIKYGFSNFREVKEFSDYWNKNR